MNIARALEVALPEMPEQIVRRNPPKLDPQVVFKEHIEDGRPVVVAKKPGTELVFRFQPIEWQLVQLFDGIRTYAELAGQFQKDTGTVVSEEEVQELASSLQSDTPLLYKTPLERNIALQQELRTERGRRKRAKTLDFSDIVIKVWHNADGYITWLHPRVRFLFTPWFVAVSIAMFVLMGWMWWDRIGEVWSDSFAFYNFSQKSGSDLIELWVLFAALAAIHETAHGLTGKHFGATVERMGFTLMYFGPSFFCDVSQVWVIGGKWARIATAISGMWSDLLVCFLATVVWWGTATGMPIHDFAYKIMMVTGIGVSLLNLNPLIKLDGYLIFSELVAEPALKETATAYLSGLFRRYVCRLSLEVPYVPRRKRLFYVVYGTLSGLYSYFLLTFLMVITYHIIRSFTPDWAFVPAFAMGVWVFRSRITKAAGFMKTMYLDKKERLWAWFSPTRLVGLGTVALLLALAPVWPDHVQGQFILLPGRTAVLRATVPGTVEKVAVEEGQTVAAGTLLLRLHNLELESETARAREELSRATAKATEAALHYTDLAAAEQARRNRAEDEAVSQERVAQLSVLSPISGVVTTAHVEDLIGRSLDQGDLLLQVNDTSELKADIYIPEFAMHDVHVGQQVRLLGDGQTRPETGLLSSLSPAPAEVPEGMLRKEQLQGMNPPRFYVGTVVLRNDARLMVGVMGTAKVVIARRSLAGFTFRFVRDIADRKVW